MKPKNQGLPWLPNWSRYLACYVLVAGGLTGCAPRTLYDWGKYEDSLYLRYTDNNFDQAEAYISNSLPSAGHAKRVPPGMYADYGFLLYRRGNYPGALEYFEKEKSAYPESSPLMTKLMDRIRQKTTGSDNPDPKAGQEPKEPPAPKDHSNPTDGSQAGVSAP